MSLLFRFFVLTNMNYCKNSKVNINFISTKLNEETSVNCQPE